MAQPSLYKTNYLMLSKSTENVCIEGKCCCGTVQHKNKFIQNLYEFLLQNTKDLIKNDGNQTASAPIVWTQNYWDVP